MVHIEIELFYSHSDPHSVRMLKKVRKLGRKHGIAVRETLASVHRIRSRRHGVKAVPTLQVGRRTVWVGSAPNDILERIFRELAESDVAPDPEADLAEKRKRSRSRQ